MGAPACPVAFEGVEFSYRGTAVLKGVDLTVVEGEMCAIIGDNGAGKSTMARLVIGEAVPARGRVSLFGANPARFRDWKRVGYVPQLAPTSIERFPATVLELVLASRSVGAARILPPGRAARTSALDMLEQVGMAGYSKRLVRELSGGQLQRVRLACALVSAPDLLVLDEPANGLDAESRQAFYRLVGEAHRERGLTVLMITHDLDALPSLNCRVVELADGRIVGASLHAHACGCVGSTRGE